MVALGEGPKRCVLPESQQPGEAFSRGNEDVPLCYFTWLLIENTPTSYRETFTSAFGPIQRVLSCFTPRQKGEKKKARGRLDAIYGGTRWRNGLKREELTQKHGWIPGRTVETLTTV